MTREMIDPGICRPGVSILPFFFYLPSALPLSSLCHGCTFPRDLRCAALCRVRGESLCSTCVKGPFLHRWGISFGIIQKFNVLFYLPGGFMAIGYPSHGSSSTALSKGPCSTLCGSIIYYYYPGGFMTMLNHIISTSHGLPKKVVDHYTSDHASLPPPPPSARVYQPMDLCNQTVMILCLRLCQQFAIHQTSTDTGNPVTSVRGLSTPDVLSSGGDAVDTHHILTMPSWNKKCPFKVCYTPTNYTPSCSDNCLFILNITLLWNPWLSADEILSLPQRRPWFIMFSALLQALLVRVCVVITGGSLAFINILGKVDEEQDISSQSVPPASLLMMQWCTVTIAHHIIAVLLL